jgi:uncharacterized membrane protein
MQAAQSFAPNTTLRQYSDTPTSSVGNLKANHAAALCYIGPFGLLFLFLEKQNRLVRFHSVQALLYGLSLIVMAIIFAIVSTILGLALGYISPTLGVIVSTLLWLGFAIFAIGAPLLSIYKAFNGQMNKLPIIGNYAERAANK